MRHRVAHRKLNRTSAHRRALRRSLVCSLIEHESIITTVPKAKEVRSFAEKLITRAKKGDLASRRYLAKYFEKSLVKKIVDEIGPRYKGRPGGYTRIIKLEPRKANGARKVIIEFVK